MLMFKDEVVYLQNYVCWMVFNATFNNISVISWRSVLLVEETGVPGENHHLSQVIDKLYHIVLYTSTWSRFDLTSVVIVDLTSVVIGTDCICSCKSNYHTITATMPPSEFNIKIKRFNTFVQNNKKKSLLICNCSRRK